VDDADPGTSARFVARGIVEGFYGEPWPHTTRLGMVDFLAANGMNAYAYAPKDDAKHRARWREPYSADETARFAELATRGAAAGVRFGFAVSPGLDIDYEADTDRQQLLSKMLVLADSGVDWFLLLLDDIPLRPGLGPRHAALSAALVDGLQARIPDALLTVAPTEYVGMQRSPYLDALAAGLPPEVDLMWTGPTVCSPTITAADAGARARAVGGRAPLVWDNYPVNDATMTASLHLGPYDGRDGALLAATSGILCNPMPQAEASKVALATAAAFFRDPTAYDRDRAWAEAIRAVGRGRAGPLATLAHACADSALGCPEELELARLVASLRDQIDGAGWLEAVAVIASVLRAARALPDDFAGVDALATEVRPWADAARHEAEAGLAALRLLQQIRPVVSVTEGQGRAVAPDADAAMQHAFGLMFTWAAARRNERVVFGPRFALYTPVVQLAGGLPGLDVALAVREDASAIDALCRLALASYADWTRDAGAPIEAFVDGERRVVSPTGAFDGSGREIRVRAARHETSAGPSLPFRDRRLT
jgi:hyaluronoglucosaminidase